MFNRAVARSATQALNTARPGVLSSSFRPFSSSTARPNNKSDDPQNDPLLRASSPEHQGKFARTDESVQIEYPPDSEMPAQPFSLENKVSLVTGGARGLGLVMGQGLVASGSDLAIVDLNKAEAEEQAGKLIEQFRKENPGLEQMPNVTAHYADVSNPDSVQEALAEVLAKHNRIDNLVTSAGFTENFDAISYPFDRMKKLWGVNVDGTYLFATGVAKHLMERKAPGSIVMIGSMSGSIVNVPQPQAPYNAAKAAVRHLAASLAVEWAAQDIRVNCISPGYMLTALTRKILDENPQLRDKWISLIPAGKMGTPEDLMGAVTFLLSDASKYITGADLRVDGGYTLT
ncbi:hypothetical protein POX_a00227 [Penicillium oxalicum]|uniref:hypothetical protein n=1 Tax=Penicillium oxalicum TaxID=69781 RepID=UPI0020B6F1C4|nr:hypothetical protein POX_a00227 [Penicillium oxalicum]KAI2793644.1 hypothetical protein POX_a00227 [Penicillium oxalicum]